MIKTKLVGVQKGQAFWVNMSTSVGQTGLTGNVSSIIDLAGLLAEIKGAANRVKLMFLPLTPLDEFRKEFSPFSPLSKFGFRLDVIDPALVEGVDQTDLLLQRTLQGSKVDVYGQQAIVRAIMNNIFQRKLAENGESFLSDIETRINAITHQVRENCAYSVLVQAHDGLDWTKWSREDQLKYKNFEGADVQSFLKDHREQYLLEAFMQLEAMRQLKEFMFPALKKSGVDTIMSTSIAPVVTGAAGLFNSQDEDSPYSSARAMGCTTETGYRVQIWGNLVPKNNQAAMQFFVDEVSFLADLGFDEIRVDHASGLFGGFNSFPRVLDTKQYLEIRDDLRKMLTTTDADGNNNWIAGNYPQTDFWQNALHNNPLRMKNGENPATAVKELLTQMEKIDQIISSPEYNGEPIPFVGEVNDKVFEIFAKWAFMPGIEEAQRGQFATELADKIIHNDTLKKIRFVFETGGDYNRREIAEKMVAYLRDNGVFARNSSELMWHPEDVDSENQRLLWGLGWDEPSIVRALTGKSQFDNEVIPVGKVDKTALLTKDEQILAAIFINPADELLIVADGFEKTAAFKNLPEADKKVISEQSGDWIFSTMISLLHKLGIGLLPQDLPLTKDQLSPALFKTIFTSIFARSNNDDTLLPVRALPMLNPTIASNTHAFDENSPGTKGDGATPYNWIRVVPELDPAAIQSWQAVFAATSTQIDPYYEHKMPNGLKVFHSFYNPDRPIHAKVTEANQGLYAGLEVGAVPLANMDFSQYKTYNGQPLDLSGAKIVHEIVVGNTTPVDQQAFIQTGGILHYDIQDGKVSPDKRYVSLDLRTGKIFPIGNNGQFTAQPNGNDLINGGIFVDMAPKGSPTDQKSDTHHLLILELP